MDTYLLQSVDNLEDPVDIMRVPDYRTIMMKIEKADLQAGIDKKAELRMQVMASTFHEAVFNLDADLGKVKMYYEKVRQENLHWVNKLLATKRKRRTAGEKACLARMLERCNIVHFEFDGERREYCGSVMGDTTQMLREFEKVETGDNSISYPD